MDELQAIITLVANGLAGGLGYGFMQFMKWVLAQYGVLLEGRLAVNMTLAVSALLGLASTVLGFAAFQVATPTDLSGWFVLVVQGALGVMGAATIIYKNIQVKKE